MSTDRQGLELNDATERIIGCAYTVSNVFCCVSLEKVYKNAFTHELRKNSMDIRQQYDIKVNGVGVNEWLKI